MDALHDAMQLRIHLTVGPEQTHGILCHFQPADCYPTCVRRFARRKQNTGLLKQINRLKSGRHVGSLSYTHTTILDRSEEHTSELQSRPHLVCRLLLENK